MGYYRPVSILSIISKVLENVIYEQVDEYLTKSEFLLNYQSGFRRKFSTETCRLHMTDYNIDKGNLAGMVLLTFRKHLKQLIMLLMKLEALDLTASAVNWCSSYLSDRHQLVDVSGTFSSQAIVICGVPQ